MRNYRKLMGIRISGKKPCSATLFEERKGGPFKVVGTRGKIMTFERRFDERHLAEESFYDLCQCQIKWSGL